MGSLPVLFQDWGYSPSTSTHEDLVVPGVRHRAGPDAGGNTHVHRRLALRLSVRTEQLSSVTTHGIGAWRAAWQTQKAMALFSQAAQLPFETRALLNKCTSDCTHPALAKANAGGLLAGLTPNSATRSVLTL